MTSRFGMGLGISPLPMTGNPSFTMILSEFYPFSSKVKMGGGAGRQVLIATKAGRMPVITVYGFVNPWWSTR